MRNWFARRASTPPSTCFLRTSWKHWPDSIPYFWKPLSGTRGLECWMAGSRWFSKQWAHPKGPTPGYGIYATSSRKQRGQDLLRGQSRRMASVAFQCRPNDHYSRWLERTSEPADGTTNIGGTEFSIPGN